MPDHADQPLTHAERSLVDLLASQFEYHRFPRPAGQLFGLALVLGRPFTAAEAAETLGISSGGTSGGLQTLIRAGLLQRVAVPGDRRYHYVGRDGALDQLLESAAAIMDQHRRELRQQLRQIERPGVAQRAENMCRVSELLGGALRAAAQTYREDRDAAR